MSNLLSDYLIEVAKGNVSGSEIVNKFGRNTDIDTTAEVVWSEATTPYPWPSTDTTISLVSSAAADDGDPVGTGARTVLVQGLNASFVAQEETLTLNGTTPVLSDNTYIRLHRMIVMTVGSGGGNAGKLSATVDTNVVAVIDIGVNQTLMAVYTLPSDKNALLLSGWITVNKKTSVQADYEFYVRQAADVATSCFTVKETGGVSTTGTSDFYRPYKGYPKIVGPADMYVISGTSANDADISAGFDLMLYDK